MQRITMHRGFRILILVTLVMGAALASPQVPGALAHAEFFRITEVTVSGNSYLTRDEVIEGLRIPSGGNIWDDLKAMETRLGGHPLVHSARVRRVLPGTLSVEVTERVPVAFVSTPVLAPIDKDGRILPIDPARHRMDLPLLSRQRRAGAPGDAVVDSAQGMPLTPAQLRALAIEIELLRELDPDLLSTVSDAALDTRSDVVLRLSEPRVTVRYRPPMIPRRLQEGLEVLTDALQRDSVRQPTTVDLRFADQVVVEFSESRGP